MKAIDIANFEQDFANTKTDSEGTLFHFNPITLDIPGDPAGPLQVTECKRADGDTSFYYQEIKPKQRIVVHFTEGYLKGDIASLTKPNHQVSVPFVIARDGTIYNLWGSVNWSNHLGKGAVGGNQLLSGTSIGIELSNVGPLTLSGSNLLTGYGDTYCTTADTDYYVLLPQQYRGYSYYATFASAQYTSLITLLRFLTNKYNIPRTFLPEPQRYNLFASDAEAQASTGIVTHVNFRPSGEKVDIGPAFDWNTLINGVTA